VGGLFKLSLELFKLRLEGQPPVVRSVVREYPPAMPMEPLTEIRFAYQLHYDIGFRTHRRKVIFSSAARVDACSSRLAEVCERHGYHLLEEAVYADHLRLALSLRPSDTISKTLQKLKGNLSGLLGPEFRVQPPMWADGFLGRSVGRVRIDAVKKYLENQAEHHGYNCRSHPPVFRYRAEQPKALAAAHTVFDLSHHIVLATRYRCGMFGSRIGEELLRYWLAVAHKRGFAIDAATVLPDHVHLIVRIVPKMSVESCALALMNNGQSWYAKHFSSLLVGAEVDRLWQPSAYVGTCGELTTALLKSFLRTD